MWAKVSMRMAQIWELWWTEMKNVPESFSGHMIKYSPEIVTTLLHWEANSYKEFQSDKENRVVHGPSPQRFLTVESEHDC